MRFFADGPALPSELINARDEGRVVFFCGAGVSLARANLPDFSGLAESVVGRLRPRADGSAQRLLNAFLNQERIPGVGGLIATDRVFGLLEREFTVPDVRRAVAASLKPRSNADLSCHRTLIDLARGPDGIVRLVTTNFDRLFEKADPALRVSTPPNLPHPRRGKAFSGIVHLHGCVTKNYGGAEDDEFVLSSSDFGRAYLAEGWATAFIQSLIREYQLVFIGYAADDPPIQYLLEALSRSVDVQPRLYAFQSGTSDEASALWAYKGVEPIAYDPTERHATLWKTLEAWAERARDVQGWTEHVLLKAQDGPRAMGPVGRGQVAQLISTSNGASKFVKSNPPGEWICVMDRFARYGQPTRPIEDQPSFDPFEAYRLDDDPEPPSGDLDQPYKDREVPTGAWDAFSLNQSDREGLADRHLALVRGPGSLVQPELPPRIAALGAWIAESCDQPIVAWWAAGSGGLHLGTRNIIRIELERSRARTISIADRAWRFILAAWTDASIDPEMDWFPLQKEIKQQGWSKERIRRWSQLARPRIKVRRPWFYSSPLDIDDKPELRNILDVELDYPSIRDRPQIDDDLLAFFVYCQRQVIESSIDLEIEISNYESIGLPPIEKDDDLPDNDNFSRTHGLPGLVLDFVEMLNRLADTSPYAWRHEVLNWTNTGTIFSRLRIWAAGRSELNGADAASLLLSVPRNEFWRGEHQRDLLLMLASRWNQFPKRAERQLETRLRRGPARWHREAYSAFRERRAHQILNRLGWLKKEGIKFSFDIDQEFDRWRADAPKWREQYSHSAAASLEGRSGWVGRDTAPKGLEAEPPATLLTKANELSGHDYDALVDIRPLEDLAESHPVRFLRALVLAQQRNEFPRSAWETFLYGKARTDDRLRLKIDVARRLSSLPQEQLAKLATPISEWMLKVAEELQRDALPIFSSLWSPLLETLRARPESAQSSVLGSQIDWATHSLNSPVGRLAQALIKDPCKDRGKTGLSPAWLEKVEGLLGLPGNARRDALVIFSHQLPWLYYRAERWTESKILSALTSGDKEDARAFWAGFFWAARVPNLKLFTRIKPALLELAGDLEERDRNLEQLSGILLSGWGTELKRGRCVSNSEMRDVLFKGGESFRTRVLWQLRRWCQEAPERWSHRIVTLLRDVWPRQSSMRTASMSDHLVDLALENEAAFPETVHVALPLLTPVSPRSLSFFRLKEKPELDSSALLDLIFAALPQDASGWPYNADEVVEMLGQQPTLSADPRLVELRRRLAAR